MNINLDIRKQGKTIGAAAALLLAATFAYFEISGGSASISSSGTSSHNSPTYASLVDPTLKLGLLDTDPYKGNGRNIFRMGEAPMPTPITNGRVGNNNMAVNTAPTPFMAPTPQPPPPINLRFYGYTNKPGQTKKAFFSEGEDIFVGSEGDVVDRHYQIVRIMIDRKGNAYVDVKDLLNNNTQTLPLQS